MNTILSTHCRLCFKAAKVSLPLLCLKDQHGSTFMHLSKIYTSSTWNHEQKLQSQLVVSKNNAKPPNLTWMATPLLDNKNALQYCLMLSKFRLTSLVVLTSMAGYAIAPAPFELSTFVMCAMGTGLTSSAANSINQFYEVPFDAQMSRTKNRVLVKGLLSPIHAVGFAALTSVTGLGMLFYGVNEVTALLGAGNLLLYTSVYTPMKRISIANTWIGSIVGAIPPLMGWAGCTGTLDTGALVLAVLLYSWQFPHFNALSWNLRPDYSRAGYRMMAVTDPALCRRVALRHTGIITAMCLAAPYLDVTNKWFALEALPLNLYFMYLAYQFYKKSDSSSSRKLFRFSLLHLPALMLLFLVNKKYWATTQPEQNYDSNKLYKKSINVLPLGPYVTAQEQASDDSLEGTRTQKKAPCVNN